MACRKSKKSKGLKTKINLASGERGNGADRGPCKTARIDGVLCAVGTIGGYLDYVPNAVLENLQNGNKGRIMDGWKKKDQGL